MTALAAELDPHFGEPSEILRRVFGFSAFRGLQQDAVAHVCGGGDALVLMPTGGGKSICYQIPALCRSGTAIVISPLIALMDDQVAALRQVGVAAGALHSELDPAEARAVSRDLADGRLDLLYVSRNGCWATARWTGSRAWKSRCSRSTRPIVFPNGVTNSARNIAVWRCCRSVSLACPAWP